MKVANHRFLEVLCNLIYLQLYFFFLKAMSSTKRLLVYTVPVTMVSFALNIPKFFEVGRKSISGNEDVGEIEEGRKNEESDSDESDDHNIDCKGKAGRVQRDGDGERGRKQKRTNFCLLVESVILLSTSV